MSAKFSSLKLRSISALIAVLGLVAIYWAFDLLGLIAIVFFAHIILSVEGYSLLFSDLRSNTIKAIFFIGSFLSFILSGFFPEQMMLAFVALTILYWTVTVLFHKEFSSLDLMVGFQSRSIYGFFYFGVLPGLVVQILLSNSGFNWFCMLLSIVFAGDIGAFLSAYYRRTAPAIAVKIKRYPVISGILRRIFVLPSLRISAMRNCFVKDLFLYTLFIFGYITVRILDMFL